MLRHQLKSTCPIPTRLESARLSPTRALKLVILGLAHLALVSCGSDSTGPDKGVATVEISPGVVTLTALGASQQLTATVLDSRGGTIAGITIGWQSSDAAVATVDPTGLVVATGPGAAQITASAEGKSAAVEVTVAPAASRLVFATEPADMVAGEPLSPVVRVEVQDANGNLVADSNVEVTVALAAGIEGATLVGTLTVIPEEGVATFEDLTVERAGSGYRIVASATGLEPGQSNEFTVSPATVHHLAFTRVPARVESQKSPFTVEVEARDRFDNRGSDWMGEVTLSLENNPGSDSLAGTRVVAAQNGTARFTDLTLSNPGVGYTLKAQASGLSAAESEPFDIRLTFVMISSGGGEHTCGVTITGKAYCWGADDEGQLGNGGSGSSAVPKAVSGTLEFSQVSTGLAHSCGVTIAGAAYCWGYGLNGQLGNGSSQRRATIPVPVSGGIEFMKVDVGGFHACGVTTAGKAYCWGYGGNGEIGDGLKSTANVPKLVSGDHEWAAIVAGSQHACGLTTAGLAYCWGNGTVGQLGNGSTFDNSTPRAVADGHQFAWIQSAGNHTCGVTTGGETYCWGDNSFGQLGDNTTTISTYPVQVAGNLEFVTVSGGTFHTCGITTEGRAYCWGYGHIGQLGNGDNGSHTVPVPVSGNLQFTMVTSGANHSCGLTNGQEVYCWGKGSQGALGNDGTTDSLVPVLVFGTGR